MKYKSLLVFFIAVSLLLFGCVQNNKQTSVVIGEEPTPVDYSLMDLAVTYPTLTELSNDSTLIAEVNLLDKTEEVSYGGANFVIHDAKIINVIKGDTSLENNNIDILEVKSFSLNHIKTTDHFILFLQKYDGPVTNDAYVITGVYQGVYSIKDNIISYGAEKLNGVVTFQKSVDQLSLEDFINKIHDATGGRHEIKG